MENEKTSLVSASDLACAVRTLSAIIERKPVSEADCFDSLSTAYVFCQRTEISARGRTKRSFSFTR